MSVTSGFFPGDGVGIIAPGVLILLEHAVGEVVPMLLAELEGDGGIDAVLEVVAGAGLRSIGNFAVAVEEDDALRLIARGDAWVRIAGEGETATFDGAGLRTWNEQLVSGWEQVTLGLGPRVDAPSLFELDRGVVPAAGLVRPNVELPARGLPRAPTRSAAPAEPPVESTDEQAESAAEAAVAVAGPSAEPEPEPIVSDAAVSDLAERLPVEPESEPLPDPEPVDPAQTMVVGALEDAGATIAPPVIASVPEVSEPPGNDYDDIFGRTVVRSVQDAAVHPTDESELPSAPEPTVAGSDPGDHDGHTITLAQLRELQQAEAAEMPQAARLGDHDGMTISVAELRKLQGEVIQPASPTAAPIAGVTVQALVCLSGHANPTHASVCGRCGAALGSQPTIVARPVLGRLVLSTGEVVELDRSAIIGRNPKIEGRLVGELPKVVRLETFQGLSRSHAMVRLEGWQVLVVDLGSANHTTVTLPGRAPQRLHPDEPVLLAHGSSIDFGGEVTATYESNS